MTEFFMVSGCAQLFDEAAEYTYQLARASKRMDYICNVVEITPRTGDAKFYKVVGTPK